MTLVDGVAERILVDEGLRVLPVVVVRAAEQDADVEVDVDKVVGDKLAVNDHAGSYKHLPAPVAHVLVGVIAVVRIVE
jgi:hypothetical protein